MGPRHKRFAPRAKKEFTIIGTYLVFFKILYRGMSCSTSTHASVCVTAISAYFRSLQILVL